MLGIEIKPTIGIGDAIQFSSVPENYYRATGQRLVDQSKPWFFDFNPYVIRDPSPAERPRRSVQMWNFPKQYEWPQLRPSSTYLSNAEIFAAVFGVKAPTLNRPRLYRFEDCPFHCRDRILLHVDGVSHGLMPPHVLEHVLKKYRPSGRLFQIGLPGAPDLGIPRIHTPTLWDLAQVISQARMVIGLDSGPSWIAAAYPDVVVKKLRTKPSLEQLRDWVPLSRDNIHSHWDDRCHQIYNISEDDVGFTTSYRKI